MKKKIVSTSISGKNSYNHFMIDAPRVCPHCNHAIDVNVLDSYYYRPELQSFRAGILFFCPNCENFFYGNFGCRDSREPEPFLYCWGLFPSPKVQDVFPEEVEKLSPNFVEIYHQSQEAENQGLNQISGMGYRKALEFLVKDYAIRLHPDETESIKSKLLSACISDYINDARIKSLASASAWIGNDEAHYVRKHEDYDVSDLKTFIHAAVSFINSDLACEAAAALLAKK